MILDICSILSEMHRITEFDEIQFIVQDVNTHISISTNSKHRMEYSILSHNYSEYNVLSQFIVKNSIMNELIVNTPLQINPK